MIGGDSPLSLIFCNVQHEQLAAHVSQCPECKEKILAQLEVIEDVPFASRMIKKAFRGMTLKEVFQVFVFKTHTIQQPPKQIEG